MKNSFSQLEILMCLVVQVVNLGSILMLNFREREGDRDRDGERERETCVRISAPIWGEWVLLGLRQGHGKGSHIAQK